MYRILLNSDNIKLDERELKKRLGGLSPGELPAERLALIFDDIRKNTSPSCSLRKTDIIHLKEGVDLGFGYIRSSHLKKNLEDLNKAYIICITLGTGADMLLRKAAVKSLTEQFLYDAVLSAYIESAADYIQKELKEKMRARFAPGYGDFDISWQKEILSFAGGYEIGISISDSDLMIPTKSITAVMGIIE